MIPKPHKKCSHKFSVSPGKFPPDPNLATALSLMCEQASNADSTNALGPELVFSVLEQG